MAEDKKDQDQKQHDQLIDRLRREGQLIRNSGTNSLRSLKVEVGKFDDALSAMKDKMRDQTVAFKDLLDVQKTSLEIENSEIQRKQRKDQLESVEKTVSGGSEEKTSSSLVSNSDVKSSVISGTFSRGIGPGLAGFLGAALGGLSSVISPMRLGGLLLRGIPIVALAPLIGEFVGGFTEASLRDILGRNLVEGEDLTEAQNSFIDSFSGSVGRVAIWTALGAIFGRRMALIFGAAGLGAEAASPAIERLLEKTGFSEDGIVEAFGQEFDSDKVSMGIGAVMSGLVARTLLTPGLWRNRIGIPALVIGAVLAFSEPLKNWLESQGASKTLSEEIVNYTGFVATGASLGMMFGPTGALVGAAIGLALGIGSSLVRWLGRIKDSQEAIFQDQIAETEKIIEAALEEGRNLTEEEARKLSETMSEARRRQNLAIGEEGRREAAEVEENVRNILSGSPLDPSGGVSQDQIDNRVNAALAGDENALRELFDFAKAREEKRGNLRRSIRDEDAFIERFMRSMDFSKEWSDLMDEALENSFRSGTKGFQDFGKSSFATLHGIEAVVPRQTPAGAILEKMFDEDFEPKFDVKGINRINPVLEQISSSAHNVANNIVFAPTTLSPVTSVQQGGSNVSSVTQNSITSFGDSSGSGLGRFAN